MRGDFRRAEAVSEQTAVDAISGSSSSVMKIWTGGALLNLMPYSVTRYEHCIESGLVWSE